MRTNTKLLSIVLASIVACSTQKILEDVAQGVGEVAQGIGEAAQGVGGAALGIAENVAEGYATAGNSALAAVIKPIFAQCTNLKELLGLSYSRIVDTVKEPNLNELTLDYISNDFNLTVNVSSAAKDILESNGYQYYNSSQKLYIFIHGWNSNPQADSFQQIKDALYDRGRNNVLALDSSKYLKWYYLRSSTYVVFIGQKLAELLAGFNEAGLPRKDIHMIGHSLGAQISGFAGKTFQNLTGTKIGRITGLDPAGPCFTELKEDQRLKSTDADFVDVIHSNIGLMGIPKNVGQQDFYPNGGFQQPGCIALTCNHGRAVSLFAESIKDPRAFPAVKCDSWNNFKSGECEDNDIVYMGFGARPSSPNGTYFLQTEGSPPYGLGESGLNYESPFPFL